MMAWNLATADDQLHAALMGPDDVVNHQHSDISLIFKVTWFIHVAPKICLSSITMISLPVVMPYMEAIFFKSICL